MLNPFIDLISNVIFLINAALLVWVAIGILLHFEVINRSNGLVMNVYSTLGRLFEPTLGRIRRAMARFLPDLPGIDLSPLVLFLLLNFVDKALYSWFYTI